MVPADVLGVPAMLAESIAEGRLRSRFQRMSPDAYHATTLARTVTLFALFEEEIHAAFGPIHAAVAVGESPASADSLFDPPQEFVEAACVGHATRIRSRGRRWCRLTLGPRLSFTDGRLFGPPLDFDPTATRLRTESFHATGRQPCQPTIEPSQLFAYAQPLHRHFDLNPPAPQSRLKVFAVFPAGEKDDGSHIAETRLEGLPDIARPRSAFGGAHVVERLFVRLDLSVRINEPVLRGQDEPSPTFHLDDLARLDEPVRYVEGLGRSRRLSLPGDTRHQTEIRTWRPGVLRRRSTGTGFLPHGIRRWR